MTSISETWNGADEESLMDDFFQLDFDFSNELRASPMWASSSTDSSSSSFSPCNIRANFIGSNGTVVCDTSQSTDVKLENVRKRSSKFMNKVQHSSKLKPIPVPTFTGRRCLKPNMSRRTRDAMLYAFPSYDKCDSLLFFPTTLSRHLNSGDIPSVAKMFAAHFEKSCHINMSIGKVQLDDLTADSLVRAYESSNILHPDKISCIHSTQVNGNQIKASGFMKFTKCRALYDMVSNNTKKTNYPSEFTGSWEDNTKCRIEQEDPPPTEDEHLLALVETGCDLLVFCRFEMTIVVDERTNKISSLHVTGGTTSVQEAKHDATLE